MYMCYIFNRTYGFLCMFVCIQNFATGSHYFLNCFVFVVSLFYSSCSYCCYFTHASTLKQYFLYDSLTLNVCISVCFFIQQHITVFYSYSSSWSSSSSSSTSSSSSYDTMTVMLMLLLSLNISLVFTLRSSAPFIFYLFFSLLLLSLLLLLLQYYLFCCYNNNFFHAIFFSVYLFVRSLYLLCVCMCVCLYLYLYIKGFFFSLSTSYIQFYQSLRITIIIVFR